MFRKNKETRRKKHNLLKKRNNYGERWKNSKVQRLGKFHLAIGFFTLLQTFVIFTLAT